MKNDDLWKVMKWIGWVYIPVAIVFILVYLFVSYRAQVLSAPLTSDVGTSTSN